MNFLEITFIAVSLCFDTLAVSLAGGACLGSVSRWTKVRIILCFAAFQGGFALAGWLLGSTVSQYIEKFDHWVAFILLLYIGGKMVLDSFRNKEDEPVNLLDTRSLLLSSMATSIDALAVGVSFAFIKMTVGNAIWATAVIGAVTALAAAVGLAGGERLGRILGRRSNIVGGLILIAIGVKILLEHLFV